MRVALGQIDCSVGDIDRNIEKVISIINSAADKGCDLVVLPEMSDVGYVMSEVVKAASHPDSGMVPAIREVAHERGINVVCGVSERVSDRIYNSAVIVGRSGKVVGRYRKIHLFPLEPIGEDRFLHPGREIIVKSIDDIRFGFAICYDLRFPELFIEMTSLGAEAFVVVSAFPLSRVDHWELLVKARALENQAYAIAVNRVGRDGDLEFGGCSLIVSPEGSVVAQGPIGGETIVIGEIHRDEVARFREEIPIRESRNRRMVEFGEVR